MSYDAAPTIHVPGVLDIIAANQNSDTVGVLLGNGNGTFQSVVTYATDIGPGGVAVGDLNGDGFADIVTADYASYDSGGSHPGHNDLNVFLGNGSGTFTASPVSPLSTLPGTGPTAVTIADLNGDGFGDIVSANFTSGNITVFMNNENGTFTAETPISTASGPGGVISGDFNGDGKADLAVSNFYSNSVKILLGNGSGGFTTSATVTTGTKPVQMQLGDLNGDGFTDLVVTNYDAGASGSITVALGNGNGTFQTPTNTTVAVGYGFSVAMGDVDNDGKLDLVVAGTSDSTLRVLKGNGTGGFTLATTINTSSSITFRPESVSLMDVNGDGKLDIVSGGANNAAPGQGEIYVALGNGNDTFGTPTLMNSGGYDPNSMVVASTRAVTTALNTALVFSTGHSNAITVGDADGGSSSETMTLAVKHGTLTLGTTANLTGVTGNGTGSLTFHGTIANLNTALNGLSYTPNTGFHGVDELALTINDGVTNEQTTTSSQTIKVGSGTNAVPVANADTASVVESSTATANAAAGVLHNDTDADSDTLSVTAIKNAANTAGTVGSSLAGTYGHLTIQSDGSYSYLADNTSAIDGAATGSRPVDSFTYTTSDGNGGTATATLSITIDRAPTLNADSYNVVESASASGTSGTSGTGVLGNDSDKDGDSLTVTAVNGSGANVGSGTLQGTYGHLNLAANGSFTYNADNTSAIDAAATGSHPTDTFTYTVSDGHGGSTTQTVSFTIDRAPTLNSDSYNVVESASASGTSGTSGTGVLGNDSDKDSDSLTITAVNGSGANVGSGTLQGTYGHLNLAANGGFTYNADNTSAIDSAATGSHPTDTFTYTVSDGHGGSTTQTVSFTIDRAPTLNADSYNVVESASASGTSGTSGTGVLGNDSDKDGDSLTVTAVNGSGANVGSGTLQGTYGHLNLAANGSFTYNADNTSAIDAAATGSHPTDTFTYTVSDGHGGSTTQTVSFTIDRPGIANADSITTTETTSVSASTVGAGLLGNDVDPDTNSNSGLSIAEVNGQAVVGSMITLTDGAHLTVNSDGTYTYDPNHAFDSQHLAAPGSGAANTFATETFTYTLSDGATATATITVNGVDSTNTIYEGGSGNDSITGDPTQPNLFHLEQGGNDSATGGAANDGFYFGGAFDNNDIVNGGGGTNNQIGLDGDYHAGVQLSGSEIENIQVIAMLPGSDYKLTSDGTLTIAGQSFTFWSVSMASSNNVNVDMHSEPGNFQFYLGQGNDTAIGGSGNDVFYGEGGADTLKGNGGIDTFAYLQVSDSHGNADGTAFDTILDFTAGTDKFRLNGTSVTHINTAFSGALVGSFDDGLTALLGNGQAHELDAGQAVVLTDTGTDALAGHTFLVVGTSGAASGYTAGADYVFDVTGGTNLNGLATTDFI